MTTDKRVCNCSMRQGADWHYAECSVFDGMTLESIDLTVCNEDASALLEQFAPVESSPIWNIGKYFAWHDKVLDRMNKRRR